MTKWPNWFSGLALGVDHLVGLEDYLLSRVGLCDQAGHGVELLNWRKSLIIEENGREIAIVGPVKGITPIGHPVIIDEGAKETASLDSPLLGELILDVAIEIHPNHETSRIQVRIDPTTADAPTVASEAPNALYLGRYRFRSHTDHELLRRPLVRRFSSLQPPDRKWEDWVKPFSTQLMNVLVQLQREAEAGNRHAAMSASALSEVAFDWPHWNLPHLERRLRYALWLAAGQAQVQEIFQIPQAACSFPPPGVIGDEIPRLLADVLVVPEMPKSLPDLLEELLPGVYLRAPISSFLLWQGYLNRRTANDVDIDAIAKALRQLLKRKDLNNWSRVVGVITMAKLGGTHSDWPVDIIQAYTDKSKNSLSTEVGSRLEKLYGEEAQTAPAGPFAFYLIARAALEFIGETQTRGDLRQYCRLLGQPSQFPSQSVKPKDRVLTFLDSRTRFLSAQYGANSSRPMVGPRWTPASRLGQATPEIRVHVLGKKGSGKSVLIREYVGLLKRGANFIPGSDTSLDTEETVVSCHLDRTKITFRFIENTLDQSFVGSASSKGSAIGNECDAAIILFEAESVDVKPSLRPVSLMNSLARAMERLTRRDPCLAMIVYSKSDEYGVLNPDNVQVVPKDGNHCQNENWVTFFADAIALGADVKWNESRKIVLDQTVELWSELSTVKTTRLAGYFVSAQPFETQAKFGLVESLTELCDHTIQHIIPHLPKT